MLVHFGDFTLDRVQRRLLRAATEVHLTPKAYELLVLLVDEAPRALSKAEIQDRLWPETFVSEGNLARVVADLRAAIGEDGREAEFVRTVYGYGYAWGGPAEPSVTAAGTSRVAPCWVVTDAGHEIRLHEGPNRIGRDPGVDIFVDLAGVSRHHSQIVVARGQARIEDLGSKNGTFVNDARLVAPVALSAGDRIRIGALGLTFRALDPGRATETLGRPPAVSPEP